MLDFYITETQQTVGNASFHILPDKNEYVKDYILQNPPYKVIKFSSRTLSHCYAQICGVEYTQPGSLILHSQQLACNCMPSQPSALSNSAPSGSTQYCSGEAHRGEWGWGRKKCFSERQTQHPPLFSNLFSFISSSLLSAGE